MERTGTYTVAVKKSGTIVGHVVERKSQTN